MASTDHASNQLRDFKATHVVPNQNVSLLYVQKYM